LLVITDRHRAEAAGRTLAETVAAAVTGGATQILFRDKDLADDERRRLGREVAAACGPAELAVSSDLALADELSAGTVHLAARDDWPETDLRVGRSCHDAVELSEAVDHAADYVTVSPVFASTSKPGYGPPLAADGLADLAMRSPVPVLALGGVEPGNVADCLAAGARGVAVMGGVMAAPDPEAKVRDLLDALDTFDAGATR
jgi:thiamine-phosphate diphosphorylase